MEDKKYTGSDTTATPGGNSTGDDLRMPNTTGDAPQLSSEPTLGDVMDAVGNLGKSVDGLNKRLLKIETGGRDEFKEGATPEAIEGAKGSREDVDPRLVRIVDEILGEDFAIDIKGNKDGPGFVFSLSVPDRLNLKQREIRPVRNEDPKSSRDYKVDGEGVVVQAEYKPEDIRSRAIGSMQSFDSIRTFCEKVRSSIVSDYQKLKMPIPEFRLKQNV